MLKFNAPHHMLMAVLCWIASGNLATAQETVRIIPPITPLNPSPGVAMAPDRHLLSATCMLCCSTAPRLPSS